MLTRNEADFKGSLSQGPFTTFKLQQDKDCDWTGLKFSPDGKLILVSTNGQVVRLIDAFQGTPLQTFMVSRPIDRYRNLCNGNFLLLLNNIIIIDHRSVPWLGEGVTSK